MTGNFFFKIKLHSHQIWHCHKNAAFPFHFQRGLCVFAAAGVGTVHVKLVSSSIHNMEDDPAGFRRSAKPGVNAAKLVMKSIKAFALIVIASQTSR